MTRENAVSSDQMKIMINHISFSQYAHSLIGKPSMWNWSDLAVPETLDLADLQTT
jgi:hypothetical protein